MNRILLIAPAISLLLLAACEQKKAPTENLQPAPVEQPAEVAINNGCYQMVISKDTAMFNMSQSENIVSGKLSYRRFEKDSNEGEFKGELHDSTINGWYRFQSEGMISVRQVIFKIRPDGNLSEGYGKMEMKSDTAYFTLPHNLNFEDQHPYIKINCK